MGQLLEAIADEANLAAAWTTVRMNAGAAGVDGQTIAAFTADEEHQLASLRRKLLSAERYVPPPVRRVEIPKPDGRTRPLGIPTVADRVVQQATVQVIGPMFEARFLPCSFGYRPGKGAQQAVWWVREAIRRDDRWVAEFDIVGFFDNLRHARLLREVAKGGRRPRGDRTRPPLAAGRGAHRIRGSTWSDGHTPGWGHLPAPGQHLPPPARHRGAGGRIPADPLCRRLRDPGQSALEVRSR